MDPDTVKVAVRDPTPAYRRGVEQALGDAGYVIEHPPDLGRWAEGQGIRVLVATCSTVEAGHELASLRARGEDVVAIALLAEATAAGYREMLKTGVDSLVARDASLDRIVHSVGAALDRRTVLPTDVAHELARGDREGGGIDQQQVDWLRALAHGATVEELAHEVGYSQRAMYRQLHRLYAHLGARGRTEALLEALRRGLID